MASSPRVTPINDLSRRFGSDSELLKSVSDLIVNGPYLNSTHTNTFESAFASFVGVEHCISVSSGTVALELSIKALELPANSIILMTANAGGYAAIASRNAGYRIKYVDVDEFGLIELEDSALELQDVSAIVVTHLYGQVCNMNALISFATQNKLKVIEDCAQAVGSKFGSKPVGSFGDISAFSFYPTKNLGGIGDSGAVCTKSQILSDRVRQLREYGWSDRYNATISGGGNFRNDEIQSLVLLDQLKSLRSKNTIRKEIWNRYFEICNSFGVQILGSSAEDFIPHLAVLRIPNRDEFMNYMKEQNIGVAIHYPVPDFLQPGLASDEGGNLTRTALHCDQVVSIPLFPEMSQAEILHVEEGLVGFFRRVHD
jgi:dTDP-4-amino-4,6-dideoxygalactose transaminase